MTSTEPDPRPGILDTNAVILFASLDPAELPARPLVSAVTLAELSVGPLVTDDPVERARRQAHVQVAERVHQPLAFDAACALAYGSVAASLHRAGRKSTARAFDTMIAATAIAYGLPLYTCNGRDFVGIDGLDLRVMAHPRQGPAAS